jgi:hypothetical protein
MANVYEYLKMDLELRRHVEGFYETIMTDQRITPMHISLYMALFYHFLSEEMKSPIVVKRQQLMQEAKISARTSYNKCIRELHDYGYIRYLPSYSFYLGNLVYINKL